MSEIYTQPITDVSAWRGADIKDRTDWIVALSDAENEEIERALRGVQSRGLGLASIGREAFPLPTLGRKLEQCADEIQHGRGFVLLRGLQMEPYNDDEVGTIFWGMGCYLGLPVTQNPKGELLGHVKDYGRTFGNLDVRGYETNAHLPYHTDGCDAVGLLCLRRAKAGGLSSIVSAASVHNELLRRYPETLPILYRGFRYIRREAANTDAPVTPRRIPVFGAVDGKISCRYVRAQIEAACTRMGTELSADERKALDCLSNLAADPELRLDMDLKVGDIQLINNYTVLHSRTHFEDWPEVERRRHMLRLWLTMRERRQLPDDFPQHNGYGLGQIAEVAFT